MNANLNRVDHHNKIMCEIITGVEGLTDKELATLNEGIIKESCDLAEHNYSANDIAVVILQEVINRLKQTT